MINSDLQEEPVPNGVILCPKCRLPSLAWNFICAGCGADLMPEPDEIDDAMRHKQENAA